jgi:hypothetical protein
MNNEKQGKHYKENSSVFITVTPTLYHLLLVCECNVCGKDRLVSDNLNSKSGSIAK